MAKKPAAVLVCIISVIFQIDVEKHSLVLKLVEIYHSELPHFTFIST